MKKNLLKIIYDKNKNFIYIYDINDKIVKEINVSKEYFKNVYVQSFL